MKSAGIFLPKYRPLLALVAGFFVIALSIFALTSNAVAKNQTDLDREARDHAYYTALSGCAKYSMKDKITSSEPAQWYGNDFLGGSPYVYSAGKLNCSQVMTEAWGWWGSGKSATAFLTAMGYVNEGGTFTFKGGDADSRLANFRTELKKLKPGIDSISSAAKYLVYNNEKDCTSTGDRRILYGYVQSDGTAAVLGAISKTCTEIASELPALKTAFETETQKDAQLAACVASGVKNPAACVKGNQNKSDIKYCFQPWSTEERDSCFSGQGNGAAPGCIAAGYGSGNPNALQACVAGSKNKDASYCAETYSSDESAGQLIAACTIGQKLDVGINVDTAATPGIETDCVANPSGEGCSEEGEETSNCKIEGVGWLLCPAMNFMGMITDGSYGLVEGMLVTPVSMFSSSSTEGQSARAVWEIMRNIANALFVISFMVIIYSQLTSTGITNYGVKKLLPKLIVAAILVNLSFIVCALAVDLSNVIGTATKGLFDSLGGLIEIPDSGTNIGNGGEGWLYIVGAVLSAGGAAAIIYAQIALLLPMLVGALAAIVTVVIVLTMRQALIILLVIISPLAFVALLLPNTEGWFKKWRGIFFVMLLMFPAVAAIFGASALAGKIIMNSSGDILVQIMGAGITIIPLFITPVIMKAAGGVLNRFAGIVNNTDKGIFDRMRNRAGKFGDRIQNDRTGKRLNRSEAVLKGTSGSRFLGTGNTRRRKAAAFIAGVGSTYDITAAEKDKNAKSSADAASRSYVADRALNDESYAKKLANNDASMTTLVQAYAKQAVKEESVKDVKAEEVLLSDKSVQNLFRVLSDTSQSSTRRAAAANQIYSRGGDDAVHEAVNYLGTTRAAGGQGAESAGEIQKLSAESFSSRKPAAIGGADASAYKTGNFSGDYESKLLKRIQDGKFGEREWSGMNPDELKRAANAVHNANQAGNFTQAQYDTVRRALDSAEQNKNIQLTPEQKLIFDDLKQVKQPTIQLANPNFADPRTIPRN